MNNINKTYGSIENSKKFDRPRYILRIPTPKMGLIDTKTMDSTANVKNKVKVESQDMTIITLTIMVVIIMTANLLFKIYKIYNRCLNDLNKI